MQSYSLTLLVKEKVDEKGRSGLIDDVKSNFSNLIKEDLWGIRGLAYPIKHNEKAFYANFEFEAEPKVVVNLDKTLRLNEDVLRYLIIKSKKVKIRKGRTKGQGESIKQSLRSTDLKGEEKLEAEAGIKEEKTAEKKEKSKKTK